MPLKTNRNCMSDRIRDALVAQILEGKLQPGDRLVELELAKQFDTSQTPIREALRELETMRLVESEPYRGTHVRSISDREMLEAYTVRGALEQLAGELAASHFRGNAASLRAAVEALMKAAEAGDISGYCRFNMEFHRSIVEGAQNELLMQAWQALAFEARVRIHLTRVHTPDLVDRASEHLPIVVALENGDGKLAGELLRAHAHSCQQRWSNRHKTQASEDSATPETKLVQAGVLS